MKTTKVQANFWLVWRTLNIHLPVGKNKPSSHLKVVIAANIFAILAIFAFFGFLTGWLTMRKPKVRAGNSSSVRKCGNFNCVKANKQWSRFKVEI